MILYICHIDNMCIYQFILWFFLVRNTLSSFIANNNISDFDSLNYYVTSTKVCNLNQLHRIKQTLQNSYIQVKLTLGEETSYVMVLKQKDQSIINMRTNYYLYTNNSVEPIRMIFNDDDHLLLEGFIDSHSETSFVNGYIESGNFYGRIEINQHIYQIEKLSSYPNIHSAYKNNSKNAIVFKTFIFSDDNPVTYLDNYTNNFKRSTEIWKIYKSFLNNGKTCSLFILVDNSFLKTYNENDINSTITYVLSILDAANAIFRSTDFDDDGEPDNIGFFIKYFTVIDSEQSPLNLIPKYINKTINGKAYLTNFSKYSILREVCLGVAFTAQTFHHGIIGISYTAKIYSDEFSIPMGGICDRPLRMRPTKNVNCLAISSAIYDGGIISKSLLELSLSHELGHSFGSGHDHTKECEGYLMADRAPRNYDRNHYHFSPCSKKMIVEGVVTKGHCLENALESYCGNGKVEEGEACDCGTVRDCEALDACCLSNIHTNACQIKQQFECHPSQGLCCTSKCFYNDLTSYGLDCRNFQKSCPCHKDLADCSCGVDSYCTNNICNNQECTRLNLLECECPYKSQQSNCEICCKYFDKCLSATTVTKAIIKTNKSLFNDLKKESETDVKNSKWYNKETFCREDDCVVVYFKIFKVDEYCILYGQVGKCVLANMCSIPRRKQHYPNVPLNFLDTFSSYVPKSLTMERNFIFKTTLLNLLLIKYI